MEEPKINLDLLQSLFDRTANASGAPDWGMTTWKGAEYMAEKLGIELPKHLIPGLPVIMTPGHMESYAEVDD